MSEFQIITLMISLVGLIATIFNLVAFFREKDRGHVRAGLKILFAMAALLGILFFPRIAPGPARQVSERLPQSARTALAPWLHPKPATVDTAEKVVAETPPPLQGSFTLELRRNILGGVDSLMAKFQFSNLSSGTVRVTAYQFRYVNRAGFCTHSFYRVMAQPVEVTSHHHTTQEVEIDAEIRDVWVAGLGHELHERDKVEITWEGIDEKGQRFKVVSSNG